MTHPEWLTRAEAADYLRVTRQTISRRVAQGKLKACKSGPKPCAKMLISWASIQQFLEAVDVPKVVEPTGEVEPTDEIVKIDVPDNVLRCQACGSVLMQRIPGGKRCGQCGTQVMNSQLMQVSPGQVRK